jgi:hypothetical protein
MVVAEAVNASTGLVLQVGKIALWMKAAGIAAVIWIIFESAALWLNYKRWRDVGRIMDDMKRIEGKLDRALKGKK